MRVQKLPRNTVFFPDRAVTSSTGKEPLTGAGGGIIARKSAPTRPWGNAVGARIPILSRDVIEAETWNGEMVGAAWLVPLVLGFPDFLRRCAASACRRRLLT